MMELSLRLDTLGLVELRYLRGRERYRDWPPFRFTAASRQARIFAYMNRDVVDQLHQQILAVEEAAGLDTDDEDDDEDEDSEVEETSKNKDVLQGERENSPLSPSFAQALERLNDLARQRLPEPGSNVESNIEDLADSDLTLGDEEDALEQLQDAFVQMMDVVRELAEELSTDALKLTGRFRCARIEVFFTQAEPDVESEEDQEEDGGIETEESLLQVELALVLRLYEEGHAKPDDLPAVELQLDVDDFERLHESLDLAVDRERRSTRRRR
jgi:hypothetical protein